MVLRLIMKTEFVPGEVWNDSLHIILMHIRFQRVNQGGIFLKISLFFCQRALLCIYFEYSADSLVFSVSNEVKNLPTRTNRKTTWCKTTRNWHLCTELRKQQTYQGVSNETSLLFVLCRCQRPSPDFVTEDIVCWCVNRILVSALVSTPVRRF